MNTTELIELYKKARPDYAFNPSIFSEDSTRFARCKHIMDAELNLAERTIIILYAEVGGIRALAELLGVSRSTIYAEVVRIQDKIKKSYYAKDIY